MKSNSKLYICDAVLFCKHSGEITRVCGHHKRHILRPECAQFKCVGSLCKDLGSCILIEEE
mgnify:FL=1